MPANVCRRLISVFHISNAKSTLMWYNYPGRRMKRAGAQRAQFPGRGRENQVENVPSYYTIGP